MLKYTDAQVTFAEIPDEITLCINISNCPCHCKGCHSPYLAEDIGEELTPEKVLELIDSNKGITCVAFMGGDSDPYWIYTLCKIVQCMRPNIKRAWYSGRKHLPKNVLSNSKLQRYSYIKLGPYIEEFGPLNSNTTNQKFYRIQEQDKNGTVKYCLINETYKFWNK